MSEKNSEKKNKQSRRKILETLNSRILILGIIGIGMVVILVGRLFFLQVIQGSQHYEDYVQITKRDLSIAGFWIVMEKCWQKTSKNIR